MSDSEPEYPGEAKSTPRVLFELLIIAVIIPAMFWLGFGVVDGFAIGFTAFLVLLAAAVEFLPALTERMAQQQEAAPRTALPVRWYDGLGVIWMLAIPLAPTLGWIIRNWNDIDSANWSRLLGISAFVCVVVPLVCVLPLLRYVRRGSAGLALTILAAGTGFPVATGAGSAYDVVMGPEWQSVEITRLDNLDYVSRGRRVFAEAVFVELADGRKLSRATGVVLREGQARVLVLRGIARVIGVMPGSNGPVPRALDPLAKSN